MKKIRVKKKKHWMEEAILWSLIMTVVTLVMLGAFYFGDNHGGHMSPQDTETEPVSPGEPREEPTDPVSSGAEDHDPHAHDPR